MAIPGMTSDGANVVNALPKNCAIPNAPNAATSAKVNAAKRAKKKSALNACVTNTANIAAKKC